MARRPRRNQPPAFEAKVALDVLEVQSVVEAWPMLAKKAGISKAEINLMEAAFAALGM